MRKYLSLTLIISAAFLWNGCDKIEGPNGSQYDDLSNINTGQKVFIEEFTGHQCGNCPAGAEEIKKLLATYPGQLVATSVHMGYFSKLKAPFTYDFTTTIGQELDETFKIDQSGGYPCAFVNRKSLNGTRIINRSGWSTEISKILQTIPSYQIDIENTYNENAKEVSSKITVKALKTVNLSDLNLVVYLTEDSIRSWQKDYSKNPENIENYVFNHTLRASATGAFGVSLGSGTLVKDASITKIFTHSMERVSPQTNTAQSFVAKNCHIVAFICDKNDFTVKQVNEEKVVH